MRYSNNKMVRFWDNYLTDENTHKDKKKKLAGGCLIFAKNTGRYLVAFRSNLVSIPNTWSTWGGSVENNETVEQAVKREVKEETGYTGDMTLKHIWTYKNKDGFEYHNYIATVKDEFIPNLNNETQDYTWVDNHKWPKPLHPGFKILLDKIEFN